MQIDAAPTPSPANELQASMAHAASPRHAAGSSMTGEQDGMHADLAPSALPPGGAHILRVAADPLPGITHSIPHAAGQTLTDSPKCARAAEEQSVIPMGMCAGHSPAGQNPGDSIHVAQERSVIPAETHAACAPAVLSVTEARLPDEVGGDITVPQSVALRRAMFRMCILAHLLSCRPLP